jgi:hypothetical protein
MTTKNRALNARLLLLIAKQRKKLLSMNCNVKSCQEQAKHREDILNKLLQFAITEKEYYKGYEKDYWELNKKYLDALEKVAYLTQEIKDFETELSSLYAEKKLLEKSKKGLIKQIKKL